MKENEIEYLHKEISCLRNELQFLNTVRSVCLCALVPVELGDTIRCRLHVDCSSSYL